MKTKILSLLREADDYLSGQNLCERFGVTRAAVWKAIKQLEKEGYQIDAVPNRGYRLLAQPELFTERELKSRIHTKWAGRELAFYDSLGSTNVEAKRLAEEGAKEGTLVVADAQTAGRGRRGRSWQSPPSVNLYFTLLLTPKFSPNLAPMLTLVMAMAVREAVEELTGVPTGIKWPNDIVINGKKAVGILTEMSVQGEYIQHVVIGVGINVGKQTFPKELIHAVSLEEAAGKGLSRAALLERCMVHFEKDYALFLQTEDLSLLQKEYDNCLVNRDREVRVLDPAGEYTGIAEGINAKGELRVRTLEGFKEIYAGEVSVRGIYDYV